MTNKIYGGAAFPQSGYAQWAPEGGMTLRDYFAAKSLPIAWDAFERGYYDAGGYSSNSAAAECAYQMADAMLEARNK